MTGTAYRVNLSISDVSQISKSPAVERICVEQRMALEGLLHVLITAKQHAGGMM